MEGHFGLLFKLTEIATCSTTGLKPPGTTVPSAVSMWLYAELLGFKLPLGALAAIVNVLFRHGSFSPEHEANCLVRHAVVLYPERFGGGLKSHMSACFQRK